MQSTSAHQLHCKKPVDVFRPVRKKRKLLKERRKQRERVELKMDLPGVSIADSGDSSLFSLGTIKKQKVKIKEACISLHFFLNC